VVIGVHAPEFAFERDVNNVTNAVRRLGIDYPVALDNDFTLWRAFNNEYWPAHYFIDAEGRIRYHHFGEGNYAQSEKVIQALLREAGARDVPAGLTDPKGQGDQQAPGAAAGRSPETYLGYDKAERFASGPAMRDVAAIYKAPDRPPVDNWGLAGNWVVGPEQAILSGSAGRIVYRFHARDLNLVLGPGPDGSPVRFRVSIDGKAPGEAHGADVTADGEGTVTEQRLYQLVRQSDPITDHVFSVEFSRAGVAAYAFTFG
jgi:hypothetical protein